MHNASVKPTCLESGYNFFTSSKIGIGVSLTLEVALVVIGALGLTGVLPQIGLLGAIPTAVGGALLVLTLALSTYRYCNDEKSPSVVSNTNVKPATVKPIKAKGKTFFTEKISGWSDDDIGLVQHQLLAKLNLQTENDLNERYEQLYRQSKFDPECPIAGPGIPNREDVMADTLWLIYCTNEDMLNLQIGDLKNYSKDQRLLLYQRVQRTIYNFREDWRVYWPSSSHGKGSLGDYLSTEPTFSDLQNTVIGPLHPS